MGELSLRESRFFMGQVRRSSGSSARRRTVVLFLALTLRVFMKVL